MKELIKKYLILKYKEKLGLEKKYAQEYAKKHNLEYDEKDTLENFIFSIDENLAKNKAGILDESKNFENFRQARRSGREEFFDEFIDVAYEWYYQKCEEFSTQIWQDGAYNDEIKCEYCGVSQKELKEIVKNRGGKLTLGYGEKRESGSMEIERCNSDESYTQNAKNNTLIFACPLCNNAKSNLISSDDWQEFFAGAMKEYYEKILGEKK